jgi:hypothetical protein
VRGGVEIETTMSVGEGPSSGRPRAPGIKENQNVKRCRRWIHTRAGEMAAKREMTMRAREGPSGGDVMSHPVLKAKPNALITCAPGSSYTHA